MTPSSRIADHLPLLLMIAATGGCDGGGKGATKDTGCAGCGGDSVSLEDPCSDTAWLEALPVEGCPDPIEGARVVGTNSYFASMHYYPAVIDPTGFYLQLDGFSVVRPAEDLDTCGGYTTEIVGGEIVEEYLYDLYLSIPILDDPTKYQGVYTYDEDAETWGDEPALRFLVGWYDASEGYLHVHNFMASDSGVCLSRVRPNRLSGALWWTPSERYAEDYDPLYITFDLRDPEEGEHDCFAPFYDSGLTEEAIWPELDCPDDGASP